jgi:hypothetical protein
MNRFASFAGPTETEGAKASASFARQREHYGEGGEYPPPPPGATAAAPAAVTAGPSTAANVAEPVHLIHIGWAKAGSSFLQKWFAAHPQIAFSHKGIAGCDTVFDLARQAAAPRAIPCRVTSAETLSTPQPLAGRHNVDLDPLAAYDAHAAQARGCRLLSRLFPTATILIVTRGPRAILPSAYSQYVRSGGERSFVDFCGMAAEAGHWWDYDHVIGLYEAAFGAENVLVLPYESLRDDPESFCRRIEARLGLAPEPVSRAPRNPSIGGASLAWYPRFTRLLNRLPRRNIVRRLYWRAIVEDWLAPVAVLLQRIRPLDVPDMAGIPPDLLRTLVSQCESLRTRPSYQPYLREYGLVDAEGS